MRFTKMHGLGNDYIYLNCMEAMPEDPSWLARTLSDRHFGVGGDGLICVCPAQTGDFAMRMFNADGSEGEMCGNGIRCLGKLIRDWGLSDRTRLVIETRAGLRLVELSCGETEFDQEAGLYRRSVEAVCQGYLYAVTEGDGAFLDFIVRGERQI